MKMMKLKVGIELQSGSKTSDLKCRLVAPHGGEDAWRPACRGSRWPVLSGAGSMRDRQPTIISSVDEWSDSGQYGQLLHARNSSHWPSRTAAAAAVHNSRCCCCCCRGWCHHTTRSRMLIQWHQNSPLTSISQARGGDLKLWTYIIIVFSLRIKQHVHAVKIYTWKST